MPGQRPGRSNGSTNQTNAPTARWARPYGRRSRMTSFSAPPLNRFSNSFFPKKATLQSTPKLSTPATTTSATWRMRLKLRSWPGWASAPGSSRGRATTTGERRRAFAPGSSSSTRCRTAGGRARRSRRLIQTPPAPPLKLHHLKTMMRWRRRTRLPRRGVNILIIGMNMILLLLWLFKRALNKTCFDKLIYWIPTVNSK